MLNFNFIRIPFKSLHFCQVSQYLKFSQKKFPSHTFNFAFRNNFEPIGAETEKITSSDVLEIENETRKSNKIAAKQTTSLHYKGEILYGIHPVYLALLEQKRSLFRLFIRTGKDDSSTYEKQERIEEIINVAQNFGVSISNVDRKGMKYLVFGAVHQGVCLDAGPLPIPEWQENGTTDVEYSSKLPLWLILDEILDPMNVGAIIRSAYYFGVERLFVVKGNSCKLSPVVSKASSGALEVMDIYQIGRIADFIQRKKSNGWSVISTLAYCENQHTTFSTPIDVVDLKITKPTLLILGNEGKGVSFEVQKLCDNFVSIHPPRNLCPGIDSLNVSVAAGVILHHLAEKSKTQL